MLLAAVLHCVLTSGPPGMVWVPGATFEMGGDVYPEEGPFRVVSVDGFWMDEHEVTNAEFARFIAATGYQPGDGGAAVFDPLARPGAELWWWRLDPLARWDRPRGTGSSIAGADQLPVVAVALADAEAYARWRAAHSHSASRGSRRGDPGRARPPRSFGCQHVAGRLPPREHRR